MESHTARGIVLLQNSFRKTRYIGHYSFGVSWPHFAGVEGEQAEVVVVSPGSGRFCSAPCYHLNATDELLVIVSIQPLLSPAFFCPLLVCTEAFRNELRPIPGAF